MTWPWDTEVRGCTGNREAKAPFLKAIRYSPLEVAPSGKIRNGMVVLPSMKSCWRFEIALKVEILDSLELSPTRCTKTDCMAYIKVPKPGTSRIFFLAT